MTTLLEGEGPVKGITKSIGMLEEIALVSYRCTAGRHNVCKTYDFDSYAHGVESGQFLSSKPVCNKGLHQKLVTPTEKHYIQEGLTDCEGMLRAKLPEGFVPIVRYIGGKGLVGSDT